MARCCSTEGVPGSPGAPGKSAYQYAQDAGFTGTEAEFAAGQALNGNPETVPTEVEAALEQYAPGTLIDKAESLSPITINAAAYPGEPLPGMVIDIVGNGREVEIEFFAPSITRTAGPAFVGVMLVIDNYLGPLGTLGNVWVPGTTNTGPVFSVKRTVLIPDGETKTVVTYAYADTAGSSTFVAAGYVPIQLTATRK